MTTPHIKQDVLPSPRQLSTICLCLSIWSLEVARSHAYQIQLHYTQQQEEITSIYYMTYPIRIFSSLSKASACFKTSSICCSSLGEIWEPLTICLVAIVDQPVLILQKNRGDKWACKYRHGYSQPLCVGEIKSVSEHIHLEFDQYQCSWHHTWLFPHLYTIVTTVEALHFWMPLGLWPSV